MREKSWQICEVDLPMDLTGDIVVPRGSLEPIRTPPCVAFAADPCAAPYGTLYCELMDSRSGLGRLAAY